MIIKLFSTVRSYLHTKSTLCFFFSFFPHSRIMFSWWYKLGRSLVESVRSGVWIGIRRLADTRCALGRPDKVGRRFGFRCSFGGSNRGLIFARFFRNWSLYLHRKHSEKAGRVYPGPGVADMFQTNFTTVAQACMYIYILYMCYTLVYIATRKIGVGIL